MRNSENLVASAAITVFLTGCIIIAHDLSMDLKELLASLTGHHWVSVSALAVILFVITSILLFNSEKIGKTLKAVDITLWSRILVVTTIVMMLGSIMVYIFHYMSD